MDKIKTIQSALKRKGLTLSRQEIRNQVNAKYPGVEINNIDHEAMIDLLSSQISITDTQELSIENKQQEIIATATKLNIDLPVEAIASIANSLDWAISSRSEFLQQLREAIKAWGAYKLQEVRELSSKLQQETEEVFSEVTAEINNAIAQDNTRIEESANNLTATVEESVKSFQSSKAAILSKFRIPA
jgi:hypothetical protein